MSSKKLNPFKDFQSDQIQRSSCKMFRIFTAHYACRNDALNLTPVTGTTNGFIFQIINSLIESWGVRLTWFDCNRTMKVKTEWQNQPKSPQKYTWTTSDTAQVRVFTARSFFGCFGFSLISLQQNFS